MSNKRGIGLTVLVCIITSVLTSFTYNSSYEK